MGTQRADKASSMGNILETVEWVFTENESDAEPAKGLTSKEAATAEATSHPLLL